MSTFSFSQRCDRAMRCDAQFAGASWAAGASFPLLLTLAGMEVEKLALRPDEMRGALWALTDPHCLAGEAWADVHFGTCAPSPEWMVHWWWGAFSEFRETFDLGRAYLERRAATV